MGRSPFVDEAGPMQTYQKALRGTLPPLMQAPPSKRGSPSSKARDLSVDARGLVEALLVTEPAERLGCMKLGVGEIKRHAFFAKTNWQRLEKKLTQAPYIPTVEDPLDVSNYETDWEVPTNAHAALNTVAAAHLFEGFS